MIQPNVEGEVIWEKEIQNLGTNTVVGMIQTLDRKLNQNQGLRELKKGSLNTKRFLPALAALVAVARRNSQGM
jgi:hypothetical protein